MKIAIIGAGISGLTLANLIQSDENCNIEFKVFEKRAEIDNQSRGIQLSPNATRILNLINLKDLNSSQFFSPKKINFIDLLNGKKITDIDLSLFNKANDPYLCIERSVLINFFKKQLPTDSILFNKKVVKIENIDNNLKIVNFSDGESFKANIIVAADGVFSDIRKHNFKNSVLNFSGFIAFRTEIIASSKINLIDKERINVFFGPSCHAVLYPVNRNKDINFVSIISNNKYKIYADNWQVNEENIIKEFLQKSKFWWENLTNALKEKKISLWPIYKVKTFEDWTKNNIILMGDAAHAMLPFQAQGAAQSIEDAYNLYENLKKKDLESSLPVYSKTRKKRISKIEMRTNINRYVFHISNKFLKYVRNFLLKKLFENKIFLKIYFKNLFNQ